MKSIVIKNKILYLILFLILLCILYYSYKDAFLRRDKGERTINTIKSGSKHEMIQLYLYNHESIKSVSRVGEVKEIIIKSTLKSGFTSLENVAYIAEITKDGKILTDDDVSITYKGKRVVSYNGKHELVREEVVNGESTYNFKLAFNGQGVYDIKIYAEVYQ